MADSLRELIIIIIIIIIIKTIIIIIIMITTTTTTLKTADEDKFSRLEPHDINMARDRQTAVALQQWQGNMSYDEDTT